MKERKSWLIVKNKWTYLLLALAACSLFFVAGDAIYTFVMEQRDVASFLADAFIDVMVMLISVYLFIRFNTYSHMYNPDHPKPEYK